MPLSPVEHQFLDEMAAEDLARDPYAPAMSEIRGLEGMLPKTYSARFAEEVLTDLALSSDVTHRREMVQAICLSAHDVAKARLWRDVIRAECAAHRLPVAIADFLVIRCADAATDTLMADDDQRLTEEIERIVEANMDEDGNPLLPAEGPAEWVEQVDEVGRRRWARRVELEVALLKEWGEHEIAGWAAGDREEFGAREDRGAAMFYADASSASPGNRPWVREPVA